MSHCYRTFSTSLNFSKLLQDLLQILGGRLPNLLIWDATPIFNGIMCIFVLVFSNS